MICIPVGIEGGWKRQQLSMIGTFSTCLLQTPKKKGQVYEKKRPRPSHLRILRRVVHQRSWIQPPGI